MTSVRELVQAVTNAGVDGVARHPVKDRAPPGRVAVVRHREGGLAGQVGSGPVAPVSKGGGSGDTRGSKTNNSLTSFIFGLLALNKRGKNTRFIKCFD